METERGTRRKAKRAHKENRKKKEAKIRSARESKKRNQSLWGGRASKKKPPTPIFPGDLFPPLSLFLCLLFLSFSISLNILNIYISLCTEYIQNCNAQVQLSLNIL